MEYANQRERVSGKGWKTKDVRLIELAHIDEFRSIQEEPEWRDVLKEE
jgi:hypothetical protein